MEKRKSDTKKPKDTRSKSSQPKYKLSKDSAKIGLIVPHEFFNTDLQKSIFDMSHEILVLRESLCNTRTLLRICCGLFLAGALLMPAMAIFR